ncbi:MAG: DUF4177 domain-containing protein [Rhodobacterales bacterium]|nr:DUF4177 domain-containing protein [Rhodobacterales bacterium]
MAHYDYRAIPAPTKGEKIQGVKAPEARFAQTVEGLLNAQAAEGWEYMRSDVLPSDERAGLTSTQTIYRTLLIFRRAKATPHDAAGEVIQAAQTAAEAAAQPQRREPPLAAPPTQRVEPTRGDPAPAPSPPEEPAPRPDTPQPPEKG